MEGAKNRRNDRQFPHAATRHAGKRDQQGRNSAKANGRQHERRDFTDRTLDGQHVDAPDDGDGQGHEGGF